MPNQRSSLEDQSGTIWQAVAVKLGEQGLDLREPSAPASLTELLNARFVDDRTVEPRNGHTAATVQDQSPFAPLGSGYQVTTAWVYGHGTQVSPGNALAWENAHHPIANRGSATFHYRGADVVVTGDRLLVMQTQGPAAGASTYWDRQAQTLTPRGIPAFLPVQTDNTPPATVQGEYIETALTSRYRVFVTNLGGGCNVQLLERDTNAVVNQSEISGPTSNDVVETKTINSADLPVVIWRDFTGQGIWLSWWTGAVWTNASLIASGAVGFDIAVVPGGFHLLWRTVSGLFVGKYVGVVAQSTPYLFGTAIDLTGAATPTGQCAIAAAPDGGLGIAFVSASGNFIKSLTPTLAAAGGWTVFSATTNGGLTLASRGLRNSLTVYEYVVHWGGFSGSPFVSVAYYGGSMGTTLTRWNSTLASKSFRVGDEVFCWLRAGNAGTNYLISGSNPITVCGFADREEAVTRTTHDNNYGVPHVLPDPRDAKGVLFTWCRPYNTGQTYTHGGNVRYGDMNFLPRTCCVQYGRSVYLSGSHVRNWDGVALGDAGFQDYPVISQDPTDPTIQVGGGNLTALGVYYFRVYAVRYNARGERFESGAISYGPVTLTAGNTKVAVAIRTLPDTNHDDITLEVYRTESLGTTFYLDGTISNSLAAATVAYASSLADTTLRSQVGDSHAAGIGQLSSLENWGPLGCSMLAASQDRLWGAGGQVTPGFVQFSKLHADGSGVGFDDLAGFQEINTEAEQVTSVIAQGDTTVAFQRNAIYVIAGTGPDNYGRGAFDIPNIVLADGAVTHFGTAMTPLGTVYWGLEGPRLLTNQYQVQNIALPIRGLTDTLDPSGVRVDLPRNEVVWYTKLGDAVLWNYLGGNSRWARWNGLNVAGVSAGALVTTDGRLLVETEDAVGDAGRSYPFTFSTGDMRAGDMLQGAVLVRSIGVIGKYTGPHQLRMRIFYNGSPLWSEEWIWQPDTSTWLSEGTNFSTLNPAAVDALKPADKSGTYMTHKRVGRMDCHYFRVEVSNISANSPSYTPFELAVELGTREGLGRVPANTFTTRIGR